MLRDLRANIQWLESNLVLVILVYGSDARTAVANHSPTIKRAKPSGVSKNI